MKVAVRPVRFDEDKAELLDILQRNLPDLSHAARFDWQYHKNPAGRPWAWFVYEQETKKPVGAASVLPRWMWIDGRAALCGQVGDFAIDANYRSLGPAVLLQKATFEPVNEGTIQLCYDCPPDDRGMSTFKRLGMDASCQLQRHARPLRLERRLTNTIGIPAISAVVAAVGNMVLKPRPGRSEWEIGEHSGSFGEEFTSLDQRVGAKGAVRSRRNAADLNWRFRDNPTRQFRVVTARRRNELAGFLVTAEQGQDTWIVDVFGEPLEEVGPVLLNTLASQEWSRKKQVLHLLAATGGRLAKVVENAHFRGREPASRIVAYAKPGSDAHAALQRRLEWAVTRVDSMA